MCSFQIRSQFDKQTKLAVILRVKNKQIKLNCAIDKFCKGKFTPTTSLSQQIDILLLSLQTKFYSNWTSVTKVINVQREENVTHG